MDQITGRRAPSLAAFPDDLVLEILLRLPPHPIHLARASGVCKVWHRLVNNSKFLSRVRDHHRTPAAIGFFGNEPDRSRRLFTSTPDPSTLAHAGARERFSPRIPFGRWWVYGCRHGRVLLHQLSSSLLLVCDLMTRRNRYFSTPQAFVAGCDSLGTVLCADEHQHGDCHAKQFLVAFMFVNRARSSTSACVYSSETDDWGPVASISLLLSHIDNDIMHTALVGNTIYWLVNSFRILKYDLRSNTLDLIDESPYSVYVRCVDGIVIMPGEDGGLGIAGVQGLSLHLWSRKPDKDGVLVWTVYRIIDLEKFLEPELVTKVVSDNLIVGLIGIAEEANVIFISVGYSVYTIHLKSMQFAKVLSSGHFYRMIYPYSAFYTTGVNVGAGHGPVELAGAGAGPVNLA